MKPSYNDVMTCRVCEMKIELTYVSCFRTALRLVDSYLRLS